MPELSFIFVWNEPDVSIPVILLIQLVLVIAMWAKSERLSEVVAELVQNQLDFQIGFFDFDVQCDTAGKGFRGVIEQGSCAGDEG